MSSLNCIQKTEKAHTISSTEMIKEKVEQTLNGILFILKDMLGNYILIKV